MSGGWYREVANSDGSIGVEPTPLHRMRDRPAKWMVKHREGDMEVSTVFLELDHRYSAR